MADGKVTYSTRSASGEGTFPAYTQNRRGELVVPDWKHELAAEGRTFFVSNAAMETALAVAVTSYVDTTPIFLVDIPTGTTMVPMEVILNQGGTVAGGVITVLITVDGIARYSSGGTVLTVRPGKVNPPTTAPSSVATAYSGPTAAAVNLDRTLYGDILVQGVTNTAASILNHNVRWIADSPTYINGPGSLVIYTFAATTNASWFFHIKWAELPTSMVD